MVRAQFLGRSVTFGRVPTVETNIAPLVTLAALGDVDEALSRAVVENDVSTILSCIVEKLPHLVDRALAATDAIPNAHVMRFTVRGGYAEGTAAEWAKAWIAPGLAATDPHRAVEIASSIGTDIVRDRTVLRVAATIAASDIDHALQIVSSFDEDSLTEIRCIEAEHLGPADADRALAVLEALPEHERSNALPPVLAAIATVDPDRAERTALQIADEWTRCASLAAIAGRLTADDPPRATRFFDLALAAADSGDAHAVSHLVIATELAQRDTPRALAVADAIGMQHVRDSALVRVACAIAASDLSTAHAVVDRMSEEAQDWARYALVEITASKDPESALALVADLPDDRWRAEALATIALSLAPVDPVRSRQLNDEALALAVATGGLLPWAKPPGETK